MFLQKVNREFKFTFYNMGERERQKNNSIKFFYNMNLY